MKKIAIVLVLLCFVSKATFAHVSHKEVKAAKWKYINDSITLYYEWGKAIFKHDTSNIWSFEMRANVVQCERLTYEGLKAIRHDQKFWVRKR